MAHGNVVKRMCLLTKRARPTLAVQITDALIEKAVDRMQMPEWGERKKRCGLGNVVKRMCLLTKRAGTTLVVHVTDALMTECRCLNGKKGTTMGPLQRCKERMCLLTKRTRPTLAVHVTDALMTECRCLNGKRNDDGPAATL